MSTAPNRQNNRFEATGRNDELVQRFFRNASTDEIESLLEEDTNRFETEHGGAYNLGSAVLEVYDDQEAWRIVGSPPSVEEHLKALRKEISCWGSEDYGRRYEAEEEVPEIIPVVMTDGGQPTTMDEVDHGSENGVQESLERNPDDEYLVTDGGFETYGAPATWNPESKSEIVGGFNASSDKNGPGL